MCLTTWETAYLKILSVHNEMGERKNDTNALVNQAGKFFVRTSALKRLKLR